VAVLDAFIPHLVTSWVIHKDVDTTRLHRGSLAAHAQYNRQVADTKQRFSQSHYRLTVLDRLTARM
jgi:hypothetical protein